jgi:hypothetical protein
MDRPARLSPLQVAVAEIFFGLDEAVGFLVAGGAALVASDLIARPTEDIDLLTAAPTTSVTAAARSLQAAAGEQGCEVLVIQDSATFCRLVVSRAGEETLVDLAVDSPPHDRPTMTVLGLPLRRSSWRGGSCWRSSAAPRRAASPTSTSWPSASARRHSSRRRRPWMRGSTSTWPR